MVFSRVILLMTELGRLESVWLFESLINMRNIWGFLLKWVGLKKKSLGGYVNGSGVRLKVLMKNLCRKVEGSFN